MFKQERKTLAVIRNTSENSQFPVIYRVNLDLFFFLLNWLPLARPTKSWQDLIIRAERIVRSYWFCRAWKTDRNKGGF